MAQRQIERSGGCLPWLPLIVSASPHMTNFQKAIFTAVGVGSVGSALYEVRRASGLESGLRKLNEKHALLVAQIEQLKSERDETQRQRSAAAADKKGSAVEYSELLRLRGEVGLLRRQLAGVATKEQTATNQIHFTQPCSLREQRGRIRGPGVCLTTRSE